MKQFLIKFDLWTWTPGESKWTRHDLESKEQYRLVTAETFELAVKKIEINLNTNKSEISDAENCTLD